MKKILLLVVALAATSYSQSAERAYIEPKFLIGFGTGHSESGLAGLPFDHELGDFDYGLAISIVNPIASRYSLTVRPFFYYSKIENKARSVNQRLNRFGAEIGFRFYL